MYFITYTVDYGSGLASLALLSGQISDGIATNFVGFFIDKTNSRIGKRTPWFIFGTLLVVPWFLGTFNTWLVIDLVWGRDWEDHCTPQTHKIITYIYYITLPALFNVGWAAVQISTMSIIVAITYDQKQRDALISYRNACTFGSNLLTLCIALFLFSYIPDAVDQFRILGFIITAIGIATSSIYLYGCNEVVLSERAITHGMQHSKWSVRAEGDEVKSWKDWFKIKQFYAYGIVYMMNRMSINVTMALTPFYLIIVLGYIKSEFEPTPPEIASVPLVSYCSSMIFTLLFTHIFKDVFNEYNRILTLISGWILVTLGSLPFLFLNPPLHWLVYIFVPVQGIGLAIGLNVSASLTSDMIGRNHKSSAFVYGAYSLVDKFASGLLLVFIGETMIQNSHWLRLLAGLLPIFTSSLAWLFAYLGQNEEYEELVDL